MPSAEKVASTAVAKSESAPPSEPKPVENSNKENQNAEQSEKSVPAIQQVISIISNKIRNLEKRKNKLDGYIKEEESGKELSSEQQKAVSKYDEVVQQLSLSKEFCKQFTAISKDATKDAKREARKNLFSRQLQETTKVRDVLMIQDLLQRFKDEGIRTDFLNARNGACSIDKAEMDFIDKFAQHVMPLRPQFSNEPSFSTSAKISADQFSFVIDGRSRVFMDTGLTYEKGRELFTRIQSCGYWEKDVKVVEVSEPSRAEVGTPNTEDLETKDERNEENLEKTLPVSAPAPAQVPTPTFNGGINLMSVQQPPQQQQQQVPMAHVQQVPLPAPTNVPLNLKTTVTAVENAYFNQMKYSQQQVVGNGMPLPPNQNDFGTNFSFLQDSELDSPTTAPTGSQQQQKMPVNVIQTINQPKHSPVQQHQHMPLVQAAITTQTFKNANFHHSQSPIAAGAQMTYPPGLKVQQAPTPHIPINYQATTQQQLNQQATQVPSHAIPKQPPVNGTSISNYGGSTPPNAQQQITRPAYPTMTPKAQYQQHAATNVEQKSVAGQKHGDGSKPNEGRSVQEKDKSREDYQQQPQIDTWTNETAGGASNPSKPGGYNNRNNRSSGGGGGAKYNNYRNSNQSRNYNNENGNGESPREAAGGTYFRNNERFNGSSGNRYDNRGGGSGGNYKPRDGNYRAGSGRFSGAASAAAAQGSSNPGQRK